MSFLNISNPNERDKIVKDYVQTLHELRNRKENSKMEGLQREVELKKVFNPVVVATQESAKQITEGIKSQESDSGINYYFRQKNNRDKYYGIQRKNEKYIMGNKEVEINGDELRIDDVTYNMNTGIWNLIMQNQPLDFSKEDFDIYQDIVRQTDVINHPLTKTSSDKPRRTRKYLDVLDMFINKGEGIFPKLGDGIFLPSNITGLLHRLRLLIGESRAGNTSATRNESIAILDELLRRGHFTQEEYNDICRELSC